jgi:hypothetical protein
MAAHATLGVTPEIGLIACALMALMLHLPKP